jgi:dolichyl-phosphate beta-glucosyltransferase
MILPPELSIVIPALNERERLPKTLDRIHAYIVAHHLRAEILVVDDGSTDRTRKVVEDLAGRFPELRLIANGRHRGKGFSVRHGMLEARGEITLFTDADLSAPIEEADKLLAALRDAHYDGAIGSRAIDRGLIQAHQSYLRELAGIIFNYVTRCVTGVSFMDTQCGFKAFRRERARILFEQQRTEGFGFDPEILFLARRHGLRVAEIPVRWAHDRGTKVNVFTDSIRMLVELLAIRWHELLGHYPSRHSGEKRPSRALAALGERLPKP